MKQVDYVNSWFRTRDYSVSNEILFLINNNEINKIDEIAKADEITKVDKIAKVDEIVEEAGIAGRARVAELTKVAKVGNSRARRFLVWARL